MKRSSLLLLVGSLILVACGQPPAPATPTRAPLLPTADGGSASKATLPPVGSKITPPAVKPTTAPINPEPTTSSINPEPTIARPTGSLSAILYRDDFSDPNSGWDIGSNSDASVGYDNGEYAIQIKADSYWMWSNPVQSFGDVAVAVDATLSSGADDSDIGVICRYQNDNQNFMFAVITADGRYGIYEFKDGQEKLLTGNDLQSSSAIKTGQTLNHIEFICKGDEYRLIVNAEPVDSVTNSAFSSGNVGVIVGTGQTGNNEVRFDNFLVTAPADNGPFTPGTTSGTPLYQDDFSDPNSGWDVGETEKSSASYDSGAFVISVTSTNFLRWTNAYRKFEDVSIEVDAQVARGPTSAEVGIICRYQDDNQNFMYATISPDGVYGIYETVDGKDNLLTGDGKLVQTDAVKPSRAINRLQFVCQGDHYTLIVNGQEVDSVTQSRWTSGDVGLIAATQDEGEVEAHFDNLAVTAP